MVAPLEAELQQLHNSSTISAPDDDSDCAGSNWLGVSQCDCPPLSQPKSIADQRSSVNRKKKSIEKSKSCMGPEFGSGSSCPNGLRSAPVISERILIKKKVDQGRESNPDGKVYEKGGKEDFYHKTKRLKKINKPTLQEGHYSGTSSQQKVSFSTCPSDPQHIQKLIDESSVHLSEERYNANKGDRNSFTPGVSAPNATDSHLQVLQPFQSHVNPQRLLPNKNNCALKRSQRRTIEEPLDKSSGSNSNVNLGTRDDTVDRGIRKAESGDEVLSSSSFSVSEECSPASGRSFAPSEATNKDESYTGCDGTSGLYSGRRDRMSSSFVSLSSSTSLLHSLPIQTSADDIVRSPASCSSSKYRVSKSFSHALEGKNVEEKHLVDQGNRRESCIPHASSTFVGNKLWNSPLSQFREGKKSVEQSLRVSSDNVEDRNSGQTENRRTQAACVCLNPVNAEEQKSKTQRKTSFPNSEESIPSSSKVLEYCSNTGISVLKRGLNNNMDQQQKATRSDEKRDDLSQKEKNSTNDPGLDCDAQNHRSVPGRVSGFSHSHNYDDTRELASSSTTENTADPFSISCGDSFLNRKNLLPSEHNSTGSPHSAFKTEKKITSCDGCSSIGDRNIGRIQMCTNGQPTNKEEDNMKHEKDHFFEDEEGARSPSLVPVSLEFLRLTAHCKTKLPGEGKEGGIYLTTKRDSAIAATTQGQSEKSMSAPHSAKEKNHVGEEDSPHRVNMNETCLRSRLSSSKCKSKKKSIHHPFDQRFGSQVGRLSMAGLSSTGKSTLKKEVKNSEFKDSNESEHDVYSTIPFSKDKKNMEQRTVGTEELIMNPVTDESETFASMESVHIPTVTHRKSGNGIKPVETEVPLVNSEGICQGAEATSMNVRGDILRVSNGNGPAEGRRCQSFCTSNLKRKTPEKDGSSIPPLQKGKLASCCFCC